jgi:hypothetical protein
MDLGAGSRAAFGRQNAAARVERAPITSGLLRKADKFRASWHFAFVPTRDSIVANSRAAWGRRSMQPEPAEEML